MARIPKQNINGTVSREIGYLLFYFHRIVRKFLYPYHIICIFSFESNVNKQIDNSMFFVWHQILAMTLPAAFYEHQCVVHIGGFLDV
jgi:hypothetical protein